MKQLHLYLQLTELKQSNIKSSSLQTSYRLMHHLRNFYPLTFLIQISPTDIFISSYHGQTFHNKPIYVW